MNLLLDTCGFVWFYSAPSQLSARATSLLANPATVIYLSVVSVWELVVKASLGKAVIGGDLRTVVDHQVRVNGVRLLPLSLGHVLEGRNIPSHHKDPFDRLLVCQALVEGMTLLTPDPQIRLYPILTEW